MKESIDLAAILAFAAVFIAIGSECSVKIIIFTVVVLAVVLTILAAIRLKMKEK